MNPLRPFAAAIARPGFRVFLMIATAGLAAVSLGGLAGIFAACTVAMGVILLGATLGEAAPD